MQRRESKNKQVSKSPSNGRVTLKALANYLNLSTTTVSFVVSGSPLADTISSETRKRILEAALKLNYRPSMFARYLHTNRTFSIAILVHDVSDEFTSALIGGIETCLGENGYFSFVVSHRGAPDMLEKSPDTLLDRAVEGMIFIDTHLQRVLPVPIVAICDITEGPGITRITIDNAKSAVLALEHLLQLGHREIAVIQGPQGNGDTEDRWRHILKVSKRHGIRVRPEHTVHLDSHLGFNRKTMSEKGYQAARELLAKGRNFTALLAFNDASAIGAMRAFADVGLRVPEDISIIGFDDIPQCMWTIPRLTTIRQPLTAMGELAANILLKKITGEESVPKILFIDPELVVRETTGPCSNLPGSLSPPRKIRNRKK